VKPLKIGDVKLKDKLISVGDKEWFYVK
jgi:hypothetical protein